MTNAQKAVKYFNESGNVSALVCADKFGVDISDFWKEYRASLPTR